MKDYRYYMQFARKYRDECKRASVTGSVLWEMEKHADIVCKYTLTVDGVISEQKTETVTAEHYANVVSSLGFFGDRVQKTNTPFGKIATTFTARCPFADQVAKRVYTITYKD